MRRFLIFLSLASFGFANSFPISMPPAIFLEHYDKSSSQLRVGFDFASYKSDDFSLFGYGFGADFQKSLSDQYFWGVGARVFGASGDSDTHDIEHYSVPLEVLIGRRFVPDLRLQYALIAGAIYSHNYTQYKAKNRSSATDQTTNKVGSKAGIISHIKLDKKIALEPYYVAKFEHDSQNDTTTHQVGADLLFKHLIIGASYHSSSRYADTTMIRVILRF